MRFICDFCKSPAANLEPVCRVCGSRGSIKEFIPSRSLPAPNSGSTGSQSSPQAPIPSGYKRLDYLLGGGFKRKTVTLKAASPGTGKTSFSICVAANMAKSGERILFVSGEMAEQQLRDMGARYRLDLTGITITTDVDLRRIRDRVRTEGFDVLFIDSLQTLHEDVVSRTTWEAQANNSLILKDLAKRQGTTVLCISQVNRDGSIAGPMATRHNVDTIFEMRKGASDEIIVEITKDREGAAVGSRVVLRKSSEGPKEVDESETCDILRHRENYRIGLAAGALLGEDGEAFVDELTASSNEKGLVVCGLDSKTTAFLRTVLREQFWDIDLAQVIMPNRAKSLSRCLVAVAMCTISKAYSWPLPTDVAFIGSLDHAGELLTVREMQLLTERAKAQGYRAVFGPVALGTERATWTECQNLKELIQKVMALAPQ